MPTNPKTSQKRLHQQPVSSTVRKRLASNWWWLLRVCFQSLALLLAFLIGIFLIGAAQQLGWISDSEADPGPVSTGAIAAQYICPMMCTPPQGEPGKCPVCGMKLVEASSPNGSTDRSVAIDAAARRIMGIRTAEAKREDVYRTIRTVGEIEYAEEHVATIAAYVDGRIEEHFAEYLGVEVAKGEALAVLYSPKLYSAQVEYLSSLESPALNSITGNNDRFSEVARDNLSELGMTEEQIERLRTHGKAQKRLPLASPIGGTVIANHKVEGDYVKTGDPICRVADLSTVWLMLELYPSDASVVRFGQQVEAEVQSLPGDVYTGRVAFVNPFVNEKTRTVAVRVEMTNFDGRLKPGDYATATIRVPAVVRDQVYDPALAGKWISPRHPQIIRDEPGECPLCGMGLVPTSELGYANGPTAEPETVTVPRNAVLMAGGNSVVYVEAKPGEFELRPVTVAALTDTQAVIRDGLDAGESVATDGNFLIDSQMQLAGKPSLLDPGKAGRDRAASSQETNHAH